MPWQKRSTKTLKWVRDVDSEASAVFSAGAFRVLGLDKCS